MSSTPPVILVDNVFDKTVSYPLAVITSVTTLAGHEATYVADYRRDRTWFEPAASGASSGILSDIGDGNTRSIDYVWLDRGHNVWGKTIQVVSDTDGGYTTGMIVQELTVPAEGTIGGDPTSDIMCVTEEGALYSFFDAMPPRRYFGIWAVEDMAPIFTGVMVGQRIQLQTYSNKLDEDAGTRVQRSQESGAGYLAIERVYPYRTVEINLSLIGLAEYDSLIRGLRRLLFEKNLPAVVVMNYGDKPERAWLYQYSPTSWSSPRQPRVHRSSTVTMREVGPQVR